MDDKSMNGYSITEHIPLHHQDTANRPTSISSSNIQAANDFVSVFDGILLQDSPCSNTSLSSPDHPENCCLCSLSQSDFFNPLDTLVSSVAFSSDSNKVQHKSQYGENRDFDFDEESCYSEDSRQSDVELAQKSKMPVQCRQVGKAIRKKSQNYLRVLSNYASLGKCEICCFDSFANFLATENRYAATV
ncbi:unnamed protein product [Gongylonema pulchrum]|uniref:Ovule protein n=1 Tax=Gongylonema pulchrum TaxID=637853 RepID=A0A183D248_9BILA|nr:unnamed protein product [Gongylonema pulchrum]